MGDFDGHHVLVTGGTSGIGHAIARAFLDAGAAVTVTGTRADTHEYEDVDLTPFTYRQCELRDSDQVDAVASGLERLDVLVNNAGLNLPGGKSEYDPDVFEDVVRANLFGAFRLATACEPLLKASGRGAVVNLGSMSSFFGIELVPGYGAAKAAVVGLTKTLAVAWARSGIRVNAVAPGLIETGMTAPMFSFDELTKPLLDRTPLGRVGTPDDVAPAVLFLAGDGARYITGQTLCIDGGFSIQG